MKIKLITLNLFQGGMYFDRINDFLKKENPDILCIQEAYNSNNKKLAKSLRSIDALKEILPSYRYHFAPELLDARKEGKIPIGNAIFSRFSITKTDTVFYDIPYGEYEDFLKNNNKHFVSLLPKNLEYIKVKINSMELNVFNTHGIWGQDGKDTKRRLQMGETIVNQIKDKKNVILAGDFNLSPTTQTVRNIEKHVKSVFSKELQTTFNVKLKPHRGNFATSVVDMIFVSKHIQILKKYCPNVDISDHFPLVCIFDFS